MASGITMETWTCSRSFDPRFIRLVRETQAAVDRVSVEAVDTEVELRMALLGRREA